MQVPSPDPIVPGAMEIEVDMVKVKLCRNPAQRNSSVYLKIYTQWMGCVVEGYCKFRAMLNKCTQQALLNNVKERVGAITLL
jgi:hypothetical protein